MAASLQGYGAIVRMLVEAKAQVNAQDEVCWSYCHNIH